MSALDSNAVSVVLKSPMYLFSAGSAQTDAATISVTVLPPSVSPHRSTMNGSPPSNGTRTDANDAASISLISIFPDARSFFICRIQNSLLPYFEILSYRSRKRLSPSNTTSVLYGIKPSLIQPSLLVEYCTSISSSFIFSTSDKYRTRYFAFSDVTATPFADNETIFAAEVIVVFATITSSQRPDRLKANLICSSPVSMFFRRSIGKIGW